MRARGHGEHDCAAAKLATGKATQPFRGMPKGCPAHRMLQPSREGHRSSPCSSGSARLRLFLPCPPPRCGCRLNSPPCSTSVASAMRAASGSEEKSRLHAAYTGCSSGEGVQQVCLASK